MYVRYHSLWSHASSSSDDIRTTPMSHQLLFDHIPGNRTESNHSDATSNYSTITLSWHGEKGPYASIVEYTNGMQ